jgi:hypothetical protein
MSEELLEIALRVLCCFTVSPPTKPRPEDLALLQNSAQGKVEEMNPDVLAVHIIQRELRRRSNGVADRLS